MGLVSCIPFLLLRSIRVELTYLSIGGLVVVWAFIASCGFPNSAIRAGIMIITGCLSVILGKSVLPVNSLCLATWIIFFILPNSITQIGTQLSIIATLGILAIVSDPRLLIFRIPIAAQITTSPIISSVFNELPILFLPVNVVASIIIPFIVVLLFSSLFYNNWLAIVEFLNISGVLGLQLIRSHFDLVFEVDNPQLGFYGCAVFLLWMLHRLLPKNFSRIISSSIVLNFTTLLIARLS